jgi:hypothetical protein
VKQLYSCQLFRPRKVCLPREPKDDKKSLRKEESDIISRRVDR